MTPSRPGGSADWLVATGDFTVLGGVTYTKTVGANALIDISGTGTAITPLDAPNTAADDGNVTFNLAIPVMFYGKLRTGLTVNVNGLLKLSPSDSTTATTFTPFVAQTGIQYWFLAGALHGVAVRRGLDGA